MLAKLNELKTLFVANSLYLDNFLLVNTSISQNQRPNEHGPNKYDIDVKKNYAYFLLITISSTCLFIERLQSISVDLRLALALIQTI